MTLARTALRLCVSACLKGDVSSRPTIAEGRVYDSRISDLSPESFVDDAKATVILLTDSDEGQALSDQNGGPPFRRMIDLVVQFGMTLAIKDEDGYSVGYPDTDARLESSLDLLEFQIIRQLAYDPGTLPAMFRRIARIRKYDNHRQVLDDTGVKIACRILTLTCDVSDDQAQTYLSDQVPTGLDLLPEPLRSVAAALPPGSAGADVCAGLVSSLTPLTVVPLDGINFTIDAGDGDQGGSDIMDVSVEIRSALDVPQVIAAGGEVVLDYNRGTFQNLILAADVNVMRVINWPRMGRAGRLIVQITNTGAFAIQGWPEFAMWSGGEPPVITQGVGKRDVVVLTTVTAGETIFANIVGQNYS